MKTIETLKFIRNIVDHRISYVVHEDKNLITASKIFRIDENQTVSWLFTIDVTTKNLEKQVKALKKSLDTFMHDMGAKQ